MTEAVQTEIPGLEDLLDETKQAPYNAILKVWKSILDSTENVRKESINPAWAVKITTSYPQLCFADLPHYQTLLYDKIDQLRSALQVEIDTDEECLKVVSAEDDLQQNYNHYLNLLILWQKLVLTWELEWNCEDPDAAVDLASIADTHKMFFSNEGLVALLEQIKFEFTDEIQAMLSKELEELKKEYTS